MKNLKNYTFYVLITTVLISVVVSLLAHNSLLIKEQNRIALGNTLLLFFAISIFFIGLNEIGRPWFSKRFLNVQSFLFLSVSILLVLSIFHKQLGIIATGLFILTAFIYLIYYGKVYAISKVYYVIFLYALLRLFGTIGTLKGFRFPELTYSFYLLPLAFCCFRIEKVIALRILRFFFRSMMLYMALSLIYWWFNMQYLNVGINQWLIHKTCPEGNPGYFWITSWSYYFHPSYISLVLLSALISGFYLHYKNQEKSKVSKLELIIFSAFCILNELVMQSRVGFVCVLFILLITGIYYLKIKTSHFKIVLIACIVLGGISLLKYNKSIDGFVSDPVRKMDYTLAIHYIKAHPWWGIGYHQEAIALEEQQQIMKNEIPIVVNIKTYTHNQLLGDMVQFGIVGALFLFILVYGLIHYAIRSRSYLLLLLISVYFLFMIIEEPLYVQEGITRFMVFLTLFVHISQSDKPIKSYTLWKGFSKSKQT